MADRKDLIQRCIAVSHEGVVVANNEERFEDPEGQDGESNDADATRLNPDEWGWAFFGFFESDEKVYAGAR